MKELAAYSILLASARATPKIHSPMSDIDVFFSLCLLLLVCVCSLLFCSSLLSYLLIALSISFSPVTICPSSCVLAKWVCDVCNVDECAPVYVYVICFWWCQWWWHIAYTFSFVLSFFLSLCYIYKCSYFCVWCWHMSEIFKTNRICHTS